MYDLTYKTTGLFTFFIPETKEGEEAYNEMAKELNTSGVKIHTIHLKNVLSQLKKAGYKVGKAKKPKESLNDILDSELLKQLGI